ncbi:MAG: M50 family metallopeptidase [Acidobacteria bacterium]|nr:M50 family metallopeptidase [Acidobacteriota bacterium]
MFDFLVKTIALGLLAMWMHEVGHLLAAWALGVRVKAVNWHLRGPCLKREAGTALQNLLISLSGPLMNLALMIAFPESAAFRLANLCMLICNLAPVRNSDGDRILSCCEEIKSVVRG